MKEAVTPRLISWPMVSWVVLPQTSRSSRTLTTTSGSGWSPMMGTMGPGARSTTLYHQVLCTDCLLYVFKEWTYFKGEQRHGLNIYNRHLFRFWFPTVRKGNRYVFWYLSCIGLACHLFFQSPKNEFLDFEAKNFEFNFYCKICKGEKLKFHVRTKNWKIELRFFLHCKIRLR